MTKDTAQERVSKGAAYLDQVRPGWAERIDTGTLTLHDPCGCIVGQLCQSGEDGFKRACQTLGLTDAQADDYGLNRNESDEWWEICREDDALVRYYQPLQDAWLEQIADRLAPQVEWTMRDALIGAL